MTSIVLIHANWCGHCKDFLKKVWNNKEIKFEEWCKEHNIKMATYEDMEVQKWSKNDEENPFGLSKNINAFPTIIIIRDGKQTNVENRSFENLKKELLGSGSDEPFVQTGGSCGKNGCSIRPPYQTKYLKYKQKYINLKQQLQNQ